MHYIVIALKGIAYGVTHVVPGLGGGLILLMMRIYEPFVDAVGNFFTDKSGLARRLRFLIPLGIGMVVGIILSAKIIGRFLEGYPVATNVFFMGLLLGTIPGVFRLHGDMRPDVKRVLMALGGIGLVIAVHALETRVATGTRISLADLGQLGGASYNLGMSFLAGGASVTPGLDGSLVLILAGTYEPVLRAVGLLTRFDIHWLALVTTSLGAVLGILVFSKSIDILIKRSPGLAYYGVLGLILGSIYTLWPQEPGNVPWWGLGLILVAGIASAMLLGGSDSVVE